MRPASRNRRRGHPAGVASQTPGEDPARFGNYASGTIGGLCQGTFHFPEPRRMVRIGPRELSLFQGEPFYWIFPGLKPCASEACSPFGFGPASVGNGTKIRLFRTAYSSGGAARFSPRFQPWGPPPGRRALKERENTWAKRSPVG